MSFSRIFARLAVTASAAALLVGFTTGSAAAKPGEPVLTVVDNTNGQWHGVREAARAWSRTPYVRVRFAEDCDEKPTYCVVVDAWDHLESGWMGLATPLTARIAHIQLNMSAVVKEYDDALSVEQLQQAVVCHELGHVLGIAHPAAPATVPTFGCMANSDHQHTTPHITEADKVLLRASVANPYLAAWGLFRWDAAAMYARA